MKTVKKLALSRIQYNKSRTILMIISIVLTTCLLTVLASVSIGTVDFSRKTIAKKTGDYHARFINITDKQLSILENHLNVELLFIRETFATVEKTGINASLVYSYLKFGDFKSTSLKEGVFPEKEDEIAGPPSLFLALGVKPVIGNKVKIAFRIKGEGEILEKEFTICGLFEQEELSDLELDNIQLVYYAQVSKTLIDYSLKNTNRKYDAIIRVKGENSLNFDEIKKQITMVAKDIGLKKKNIVFNNEYLFWRTNPGTETFRSAVLISLIVLLFSGLVLYSIFYISIITNIQELGKLKAVGATKKQLKKMLLREGFILGSIGIPIGILIGYLISYIVLLSLSKGIVKINMFSSWALFIIIFAIFITIYFALKKPIHLTAKISAVDAIRYQEQGMQKQVYRKGYETINLTRLSYANLNRNKKRTFITIFIMGLSCTLFISISSLLSSVNAEDIVRSRMISKGDFLLNLNFSTNDKTYPENNLNSLQKQNLLGGDLIQKILSIPGVTKVEPRLVLLGKLNHSGEDYKGNISIGTFTKEDLKRIKDNQKKGTLDYDELLSKNGIIYTWDPYFEEDGFHIGDTLNFTLYDGDKKISYEAVLMASTDSAQETFLFPEEIINELIKDTNATGELYIYAEKSAAEKVKIQLQKIKNTNPYYQLISFNDELKLVKSDIKDTKYHTYFILAAIGIISFINFTNTMITSIATRKKELGILQAIGLSNKQLKKMLYKEGFVFTLCTLISSLTAGNFFGYLLFLWAKKTHYLNIIHYHYPIIETIIMITILFLLQVFIIHFINRYIHKEPLIERIREQE